MKRLVVVVCLVAAWPASAQQEPSSEAVANLSRDWSSVANAMRHAAAGITALIQERNALEARVKELEGRLKPAEEKQ